MEARDPLVGGVPIPFGRPIPGTAWVHRASPRLPFRSEVAQLFCSISKDEISMRKKVHVPYN